VAAIRSGLSGAWYGHARHRAARTPVHRPSALSRRAHVRRHSRVWAGLVVFVVGVVAWRLFDASSSGDPKTPTSPTGSSVSTSTVNIGDGGDVHVVVNLHFAAPVDHLTLQVSKETWAGGKFEPVVNGIGLDIAGRQVNVEDPLAAGQQTSVALPSDAVEVRLEYDATGTFAASTPSSPGRGLVLLTPLTVQEEDTLSQVEVLDARVLNLGCVGTGELSACATRDGDTWLATPVADADQVIAQVDLQPRS
jgi:hypothetical protein